MGCETPCECSVPLASLGIWALYGLAGCDPGARGDRAWEDGDIERAVQVWASAGDLEPAHQGRLARAQIRLGDLEGASRTLEGLPQDQRTAEGQLAAGLLLLHLGDLPAASAAFQAGRALEPLPELLVNQCTALSQLGNLSARATCQDAIEADPMDPRPYLGLAAASTRELEEASREALGVAITRLGPPGSEHRQELAPWIGELWRQLGEHASACSWGLEGGVGDLGTAQDCLKSGRTTEARPLLEDLAEGEESLVPQRLLFQLDLDRAERATPGPQRVQAIASANRWYQRLQSRARPFEDPSWLNDLGRLAWLEDQPQQAEAFWRQALEGAPSEPAPRLNLARALDRRGTRAQARALLQDAKEAGTRSPGLEAIQLALARLEIQDGEVETGWARLESTHRACISLAQVACAAQAALELARLEAPAGQQEDALQHLEQALAYGGEAIRAEVSRDAAFDGMGENLRFRQLIAKD